MMDLPATLATIWKELHPHIKRALDLWERQLNQEPLVVENKIHFDESYDPLCVNCCHKDNPDHNHLLCRDNEYKLFKKI